MQLTTFVTILLTTLVGMSTAAAVEKRIPVIAGFTLSTSPTCPINGSPSPERITTRVNIAYGSACNQCVSLSTLTPPNVPPTSYTTISDAYSEPRCTVTLFQTFDCSDDGVVTGSGCWMPDGGIKGYKVGCPWWPPLEEGGGNGGFRPCSGS